MYRYILYERRILYISQKGHIIAVNVQVEFVFIYLFTIHDFSILVCVIWNNGRFLDLLMEHRYIKYLAPEVCQISQWEMLI